MPRITYSKGDLLAFSTFKDRVTLSDEQKKKFEVIEMETAVPKRSTQTEEKTDRSKGRNQRAQPMPMNERFAPPQRRGGNRNHETFEEGVKYELQQNAAHQKQLQETIKRESQKSSNAKQPERDTTEAPSQSDELDQLINNIAVTNTGTSQRSRFFSSENARDNNNNNNNNNATQGGAQSQNRWKSNEQNVWHTGAIDRLNKNLPEGNPNPTPNLQGNPALSGMPSGIQLSSGAVVPSNYSGNTGFMQIQGVRNGTNANSMQMLNPPADQQRPMQSQQQMVNAADLEQMLFSKAMTQKNSPSPAINFGTKVNNTNSMSGASPSAPGGGTAINVADLEAMLLRQSGGPAHSMDNKVNSVNLQQKFSMMQAASNQKPVQSMMPPQQPQQQMKPGMGGMQPPQMAMLGQNTYMLPGQGAGQFGAPSMQPMMFQPMPHAGGNFMAPMSQPMPNFGTNPQMLYQLQQQQQQQQQHSQLQR